MRAGGGATTLRDEGLTRSMRMFFGFSLGFSSVSVSLISPSLIDGRRREGGLGGLASEADTLDLLLFSMIGVREDLLELVSDTDGNVGGFEVLVSVVGFVYFGSSSSLLLVLSSSLLLTVEEVEVVPCKEEARDRGGLAGDLVRMAR